jgi:hypothetical protein
LYVNNCRSGIVGLCTALPLGDVLTPGGELDDAQAVLLDLIREGRRLLLNVYQVRNQVIVENVWHYCTAQQRFCGTCSSAAPAC